MIWTWTASRSGGVCRAERSGTWTLIVSGGSTSESESETESDGKVGVFLAIVIVSGIVSGDATLNANGVVTVVNWSGGASVSANGAAQICDETRRKDERRS